MEHLIVDCSAGEERREQLSEADIARRASEQQAIAAERDRLQADRAARLGRLRAAAEEDPRFGDLLAHLGVV